MQTGILKILVALVCLLRRHQCSPSLRISASTPQNRLRVLIDMPRTMAAFGVGRLGWMDWVMRKVPADEGGMRVCGWG